MKPLNPVVSSRPKTVFDVMSRLAAEYEAINLGQGFPDFDGPRDIRGRAAEATIEGPNQYPQILGVPELRQAVAAANRRFYGIELDWMRQVLITSGATEALAATTMAVLAPGDEAIVFEPAYDAYFAMIEVAGAKVRAVQLQGPDWTLDEAALRAAFSENTKLIILNSPLNPIGKVFDADELALIAKLAIEHDVIVACDEVYEHIVFDGHRHIPLYTLPGMAERTLRISSAGKTFSLTGWKVGYTVGPADLIHALYQAHQYLTATTPPNLQAAIAYGLGKDDAYFNGLSIDMQAKRDRLAEGLEKAGFGVLPCEGTYFLTADTTPLGSGEDDVAFCKAMIQQAGVAAIPISAFYHHASDAPRRYVRFCFAKGDTLLDAAVERLCAWSKG